MTTKMIIDRHDGYEIAVITTEESVTVAVGSNGRMGDFDTARF